MKALKYLFFLPATFMFYMTWILSLWSNFKHFDEEFAWLGPAMVAGSLVLATVLLMIGLLFEQSKNRRKSAGVVLAVSLGVFAAGVLLMYTSWIEGQFQDLLPKDQAAVMKSIEGMLSISRALTLISAATAVSVYLILTGRKAAAVPEVTTST